MNFLVILNHRPYDGTDVTWNALRLASQAQKDGMSVRIFLMNDSVDLARRGLERGEDYDLQNMLQEVIANGVEAKLCKTCITRCGLGGSEMITEVAIATMPELAAWIADSERVVTF